MHRSGTSAIARGLQVVGIKLGDNLLPPGEDNEKGFWEDQDIVIFNENLLKAIGHEWFNISPITSVEVDFLCGGGFLSQAIDLLRQKVSLYKPFGFKDPRIAKLISFWTRVFEAGAFRVKYVLIIRNPLSIAQSLEKRDNIDHGFATLLWTEHILACLSHVNPKEIILIDYDQLMSDAGHELTRIANWLGYDVSLEALECYQFEFLESRLRHTCYEPSEFYSDNSAPSISRDIYRFLINVLNGQESIENGVKSGCIKRWADEFSGLKPILNVLDRQHHYGIENSKIANNLQNNYKLLVDEINKQDLIIKNLAQDVTQRDLEIKSLAQDVADRDLQINNIKQDIIQRDLDIVNYQILSNGLKEDRDNILSRLSEYSDSNSWRLTAPLRALGVAYRHICKVVYGSMIKASYVLNNQGFLAFLKIALRFSVRRFERAFYKWHFSRLASTLDRSDREINAPLVSFVIPVYDRTDVLRLAIESALNQSMQVFEVILVTDGSPVETLDVVNDFSSDLRVRIFNYPCSSGNAVRGRNKGILESRGKYIAFLDSDDFAVSNRLELSLPILEAGEADVVYGGWRAVLDGTRNVENLCNGQEIYSPDCSLVDLLKACVPCQSTVIARRELFYTAGFLKPEMEYREDHELWARLAYYGAIFKSIPYILTELRLHSGNNEINFKENDRHWESLLVSQYRTIGPIPQKIYFLVGDLGISGGLAVVLRYITILMQAGHDASIIDLSGHGDVAWFGNPAVRVYRMSEIKSYDLSNIDMLFATFWTTVPWLEKIQSKRKLYLVQSDERLFYEDSHVKEQVAATYNLNYEYVTVAKWISDMLHIEFSKASSYIPNGLDTNVFFPGEALEPKRQGRLRVLIEGPISVPFKGVKDAYEAVSGLDCELWIVSSHGEPDKRWKYDRFFSSVSQLDMRSIYCSCDILVKLSRVESFSYPPLEAMACGCAVVIGEVSGGIEYANDGDNVIVVPQGNINQARNEVTRLLHDDEFRKRLVKSGYETVKLWSLDATRQALLSLVHGFNMDLDSHP